MQEEKVPARSSDSAIFHEELRLAYEETCRSYHAISDFRAKLLSFLPLASAGVLFLSVVGDGENAGEQQLWQILPAIGLFGFVVTYGLWTYELRGINRCSALIDIGYGLEHELGLKYGQFKQRPSPINCKIGTASAGRIIYPAVLAMYGFLVFLPANALVAYLFAAAVFIYFRKFYWDRNNPVKHWRKERRQILPGDHPVILRMKQ